MNWNLSIRAKSVIDALVLVADSGAPEDVITALGQIIPSLTVPDGGALCIQGTGSGDGATRRLLLSIFIDAAPTAATDEQMARARAAHWIS